MILSRLTQANAVSRLDSAAVALDQNTFHLEWMCVTNSSKCVVLHPETNKF